MCTMVHIDNFGEGFFWLVNECNAFFDNNDTMNKYIPGCTVTRQCCHYKNSFTLGKTFSKCIVFGTTHNYKE